MCGIVAVLSPRPVERRRLRAALDSMRQRGPDGRGEWWSEDGRLGLGHTRLAINDPVGGGQPFHWADRYAAVVNGELYAAGETTRGSDCWRLARAWEQVGFPAAPSQLRGEFAWVVADPARGVLQAARDRFGIKPLFWARWGEETWLASKPAALWAAGLRAGWSAEGFWHAASTQYPPLGGSLFEAVREVPPAHAMTFSFEGVKATRYWRVPVLEDGGDQDSVTDFRAALEEAVTLRLRAEEGTAVQLSGGVDSASVLALAQRAGPPEPLHAFSVDFSSDTHPAFSEGELARAQAGHTGIERHTVLSLSASELLEGLRGAVRGAQGISVNAHGVAKFRLAQAVQEAGLKVVLSGEGADELLFGYRHFLAHLPGATIADPLADPAGLGILTSRPLTGESWQGARSAVVGELGFFPEIWVSKWGLGQRVRSFLRREFLDVFQERDPFLETLTEADLDPAMTPWEVARSLWLSTALRSYILEVLGDGCEMAHSVEGRPPFLDHHLWERVSTMPVSLITASPGKGLLRQAVGGLLAPQIHDRPKHPFMAPPLGAALREELARTVQEQEHPFVDRSTTLRNLKELENLQGPDAWEWEPPLLWLLSSYHLQSLWS